MEKILTVIVPTYNMEKYLDKCLTSLILSEEQMNQLEVLVINDGSKDRSSEIAHGYEQCYPQTFRVIDKENGNYGSCINRGLKEATGKYVKVLDADDCYENKNLGQYLSFLQKTNVDLVINDFVCTGTDGKIIRTVHYNLPTQVDFAFSRNICRSMHLAILQMHAVAYKLDVLRSMGYIQTEGISYTDQEWVFTPLMKVQTICYFDKIIYRYLLGRPGQTMAPEIRQRATGQEAICVLRKLKDLTAFRTDTDSLFLYLEKIVLNGLYNIYYAVLVEYPNLQLSQLKEFDAKVRGINAFYADKTNDFKIRGTGYHFVRKWRNTGLRDSSWQLKTALVVSKVYIAMRNFYVKYKYQK